MHDREIAMARCDLPVPVPPTRTALRCSARKGPDARLRTRLSLIGVWTKGKPSRSLASGNLAMVIWYLIERACFSAISAASSSPMMRAGQSRYKAWLALDRSGHHLVVSRPHAEQLERGHQLEDVAAVHQPARRSWS